MFTASTIAGVAILFMQPYRVVRIMTFLDPWKNAKTSGFQIIQSYLALASGEVVGKGLGNSSEKLFYLPEAHNDFILSVIGEELGFVGVVSVVILYLLFLFLGLKAAFTIRNRLGKMLITSITFTIVLQALLNMGVVMGLLPTKGLNLPFVSYGGSSIIVNLFAIGIVLSTIRAAAKESSVKV
jgi:cell division protein FtsW